MKNLSKIKNPILTFNLYNSFLFSCVKTVIVTSSVAAVMYKHLEKDHVVSEEDFSDEEYQKKNNFWYPLSKTLAEKELWQWEKTLKREIRICVKIFN